MICTINSQYIGVVKNKLAAVNAHLLATNISDNKYSHDFSIRFSRLYHDYIQLVSRVNTDDELSMLFIHAMGTRYNTITTA